MRFVHLVIAVAMIAVASLVLGPDAAAADGENTAAITDAVKAGAAAAAPSAFGGNWIGAAFGFLAGAIPGILAVLQHQASTRWNIFHAQQHIDAARAVASIPPVSNATIGGPQ